MQNDELFDVFYDVNETLFDRIRELMDCQTDISALKSIREHVVRAVAAMEHVTPECIHREIEEVRTQEPGT